MEKKIDKDAIFDIIDLSPLQKGILFHILEDPSSEAYIEKVFIELKGELVDQWFESAWKAIIQSHDTLRTVYRWERIQNPAQIILKEKRVPIDIYRPDSLLDFDAEQGIICAAKIDLQENPFRIILIKKKLHHSLWLIYSHLLLDGWSVSLLIREFLVYYQDLAENRLLTQIEKPKFRSYIKHLQNYAKNNQQQYWETLLNGFHITRYVYPDQMVLDKTSEYKWLSRKIEPDFFMAISSYAKFHHVSISTVFYLCWAMLLHKYGNANDIVFGITSSQRNLALERIEEIVGLMINTIPVRIQLTPESKIEDLLSLVQDQVIQSQEQSTLSLPEIKKTAGLSGREEIFDSLIVVENYPTYSLADDSNKALLVSSFSNKEFTHYPLTIIVDLLGETNIKVSYDIKLYSESYVNQIVNHLFAILSIIYNEKAKEISLVELMSSHAVKTQVEAFNRTTTSYPKHFTVIQLFKEQVKSHSSNVAVVDKERQLTYKELDDLSDQLANQIKEKGVKSEEKIGVMLSKGAPMIIALLAILKVEAVYVPINPKLPQARKDYIIADCVICYVLKNRSETDVFPEILLVGSRGALLDENSHFEKPKGPPLCYILYSSGSTGNPKGILINQKGIIRLVKNTNFISFRSSDHILSTCPLDFDVSGLEIWGALLNGSVLYLVEETILLMTDIMEETLRDHKINKLWLSTPLFNAWVNENIHLFSGLEHVIIGGDILSPTHIQKVKTTYPNLKMTNGYGPTENSVISTSFEIPDVSYSRIPIGKPISNSTAYIVNTCGQIQPVGAVGEIWLGGDGVGEGYQNNQKLTRDKFIKNPFGAGMVFRSGDLGRWLVDGSIDFLGRKDFQVKVRGFRIELFEVELAIKAHPLVAEAVVKAEERSTQDKELVAYVQRKSDFPLADLKIFLTRSLPFYCIPSTFVALTSFPLTPTGKIDRHKLNQNEKIQILEERDSIPKALSPVEASLQKIYAKVLQKPFVNLHDNFFDIGGNSLHTIQIRGLIQKELQKKIPITDIFQFPSISLLAKHLEGTLEKESFLAPKKEVEEDIAIIGLNCKFPQANTIIQFWKNLNEGRDSIQHFSIDELREEGLDEEEIKQANYVAAKGMLEGVEYFDHHFFGYSEREAEMMDPQMRLLHECCWGLLEDAGYVVDKYKGRIGLFVGSEVNVKWVDSLLNYLQEPTELWQAAHYSIHSITTPISYKLKLTGPSLTIDTACSSSLVAIHQAKLSLLFGECDMAIAGGVSIELPKKGGYTYEEGMIRSSDGICRAFDAKADGTVSGDGIGLVLLKPLKKAILDNDHIYAVLKGSAINNDGDRKVGYTAPSIPGQVEVIRAALSDAAVDPKNISYIEAHGTGTKLGDPIEIKALSKVFPYFEHQSIGIGSVKTNIGHLNTASGVAGFIKTVLSLYHRYIPASLHFEVENPECDFANTPFKVVSKGKEWMGNDHRLASVSSFGIGGTNAHVILQESPTQNITNFSVGESSHLLLLSAKSKEALQNHMFSIKNVIKNHASKLEDISYTLQVGRKHFEYRTAFLCANKSEAEEKLSTLMSNVFLAPLNSLPTIAFVFSGQTNKSPQISWEICNKYPSIKSYIDSGLELVMNRYDIDLSTVLSSRLEPQISQSALSEVLTFIYNYAVAIFLEELGITPLTMLGHGMGEYVAACLSGVFSFENGIYLLMERAFIIDSLPKNKTLALRTSKEKVEALIQKHSGLWIVAENSPEDFVLAGDDVSIENAICTTREWKIPAFLLNISQPSHFKDHENFKSRLFELFSNTVFHKPKQLYISSLTGDWINPDQVISPEYWMDHFSKKIQFSKGIQLLIKENIQIFVEICSEKQLTSVINHVLNSKNKAKAVCSAPHPVEKTSDEEAFLGLLQYLWLKGLEIEWNKLYTTPRMRVSLPTYPFDRYYFWKFGNHKKQRGLHSPSLLHKESSHVHMLQPLWKEAVLTLSKKEHLIYWFIHRGTDLDDVILNKLRSKGQVFDLNLSHFKDSEAILQWCKKQIVEFAPHHLVYTCYGSVISKHQLLTKADFDHNIDLYFYPLLEIIQFLAEEEMPETVCIRVIGREIFSTTESEAIDPIKSILPSFLRSVRTEYPNFRTQFVDIGIEDGWSDSLLEVISSEIDQEGEKFSEIAIRPQTQPLYLTYNEMGSEMFESLPPLKKEGVYLITGGMGGIGLILAEFLAKQYEAKLILVSRLPNDENPIFRNIKAGAKSLDIESLDVGNEEAVQQLIANIYQKYGVINGVIHLAGIADEGLIQTKKKRDFEKIFQAKVFGTINLINALQPFTKGLDFVIFGSSIASARGDFGQSAYVMANQFLNSFASHCRKYYDSPVISINWDTWGEVGMAKQYHQNINKKPDSSKKSIVNTISLQAGKDWFLDEHLVQGCPIMPGTGFISLLIKEMVSNGYSFPMKIKSIHFIQPLMLKDELSLDIQLSISSLSDVEKEFQFSFRKAAHESSKEHLFCEGIISIDISQETLHCVHVIKNFEEYNETISFPNGKSLKDTNKNMQFGPRWDNVEEIAYSSDKEGIAKLHLKEIFQADLAQYCIHPALLDTATSFLLDVFYLDVNLIPLAYKNLTIYRSFSSVLYSSAVFLPQEDALGKEAPIELYVQLFDSDKHCCLECNVIFKKVNQELEGNYGSQNYTLTLGNIGQLDSLNYQPLETSSLLEDEVEFENIATGLNFKEVLYSLGLFPSSSNSKDLKFGLEASGIITKVGKNVVKLKPGDAVLGMVSGGFDRFVKTKERNLILKPSNLSFEEAASIPVAFLTAYSALVEKANLKAGDKILIHSATGGVGLAAVKIAQQIGAQVYATAGSEKKRAFLEKMGVYGVFSSRDDRFAEEIMTKTHGYGVDVVLNFSTGKMLNRSLEIVAPYGRFIEIGIKDIIENSPLGMSVFQKNISFISLSISPQMPNYINSLQEIGDNFIKQIWEPIPITLYDHTYTTSAFELLASAQHIGKVVVVHQDADRLRELNTKYSTGLDNRHQFLTNEEGIAQFIKIARLAASKTSITEVFVTKHNKIQKAGISLSHATSSLSRMLKKQRPFLNTGYVFPSNETEQNIINIIQDYLGIEKIGVHDNFTDLGITSLDVIQIKSLIAKSISFEVPVVQFYSFPTAAKLSNWIQKQKNDLKLQI